jgi:hypothetical protein
MLKDLLAIVDDAELSSRAIDAAVTFAEYHDAHLALTVLTEPPVLVAAFDPLGYCWPEPGRQEEHARRLSAIREATANGSRAQSGASRLAGTPRPKRPVRRGRSFRCWSRERQSTL